MRRLRANSNRYCGAAIAPVLWPAYLALMDRQATYWLIASGLALALVGLAGDRARRRAPLAWHAHLPWNGTIFVGLALMLFGLVHLASLARQA